VIAMRAFVRVATDGDHDRDTDLQVAKSFGRAYYGGRRQFDLHRRIHFVDDHVVEWWTSLGGRGLAMHNPYDVALVTDDDAAHRSRIPPSLGGDDFASAFGSPIIAPGAGVVDLADDSTTGSGGRMVGVNHGDGIRSEQLHASRLLVVEGDKVEEGQTIALSGGSAHGSEHGVGPQIHAHFVVDGTRHGWLNFLATVGAPASDDGPSIDDRDAAPTERSS
jgi:Peptidase family M23